jgi:hypothetical protein
VDESERNVERANCLLREEEYSRKAAAERARFIELSIMEDSYCPECGSRVYVDENDYWRCMRERGFCSVIDLYRTVRQDKAEKLYRLTKG